MDPYTYYLVTMILFFVKEKIGKWLVIGWMSMWLLIQIMCHEWYTFLIVALWVHWREKSSIFLALFNGYKLKESMCLMYITLFYIFSF